MAQITLPTIPVCTFAPAVLAALRVRFPFGIQVESMRTSARKIPTPDELLIPFLHQLNGLIAPFAPILSLADLSVAVIAFAKSVPDAIMSLSPDPIIDAITNLVKKAQLLPQFIPGMPYVILTRDIIGILRAVLSELRSILAVQLHGVQTLRASAVALAGITDTPAAASLATILECATDDLRRQQQAAASATTVIATLACALVTPIKIIELFLPEPARRELKEVRCGFGQLLTFASPVGEGGLTEQLDEVEQITSDFIATLDTLIAATLSLEELIAAVIGESVGSTVSPPSCFDDCPPP